MHILAKAVCTAIAFVLVSAPVLAASADRVRFLEGPRAAPLSVEELAEEVKGYLPAGAVDVKAVLPVGPAVDSTVDKADVEHVRNVNAHASAARWQKALLDDASVYDRFADQLGFVPDRRRMPRFVRLLNRVSEDAFAASGEAKKLYPRPRPFQRFALKRVCGQGGSGGGASYPSGHAVVSWTVALIMVEMQPAGAQAIVARAADYGESRVVCGLHFPSDITAGQAVAAAIVDKLLTVEVFRRDLQCAKTELQSVRAGLRADELPACQ